MNFVERPAFDIRLADINCLMLSCASLNVVRSISFVSEHISVLLSIPGNRIANFLLPIL